MASRAGFWSTPRPALRRLVVLPLASFAFSLLPAYAADEVVVPPNVQAAAVVRILEYDRALKTWAGGTLTVGVIAKDSRGGGAAEFSKALSGREVQGMPVKVVEHSFKDADALGSWLEQHGVRLVYLAQDLSSQTGPVLSASNARKLASFAPTREQFQAGGTLGLVVHEGRPRVLVNLPSSKAAGMNLDPKLLELSEVIR